VTEDESPNDNFNSIPVDESMADAFLIELARMKHASDTNLQNELVDINLTYQLSCPMWSNSKVM
jgi:hypothetical protein